MPGGREIVTSHCDFRTLCLREVCVASWWVERESLLELRHPHEMAANYHKLARPLHKDRKNNANDELGVWKKLL